jgi:2-oxoisovalerate dehydrogenase E2 component (dihydrolipoyl transacylase)
VGDVFRLPDLGEGLQEAEIVAWHVGAGDHVVADQPLVSVETDKALVDIPSPRAGRIGALHGDPGDVVAVGAPLVEFAAGGADAGAIVGELDRAELTGARHGAPERTKAAPAVRKLAQSLGIGLNSVAPTGPGGSITRADVEAAATAAAERGEALRGVRRAMAENMTRAGRQVVRASLTDEADIDAWAPGADVTIRLIRAVAAGCGASRSLNAWYDAETGTRVIHRHIDIGIAAETDEGLFAPVLRDIGGRDADSLRRALDVMKADIENRSVPHSALTGQTITLSNFGMFGGRFAELVVVPPQVAIIGAGRIEPRVVAAGGTPTVHRVMPLSLTFDHRVVTGIEATRFLNAVIDDLRKPQ